VLLLYGRDLDFPHLKMMIVFKDQFMKIDFTPSLKHNKSELKMTTYKTKNQSKNILALV